MMQHEDIQEQLSAYLDGELSPEDAVRVESALKEDAALAAELERLRKTREFVQSLPRQEVGDDFTAKVMHTVRKQGAMPWRPNAIPNPWRRYLAAAALVLLALGLGVYISISLYDVSPQPSPPGELAIKTSDDAESLGTVARDMKDLRSEITAEDTIHPVESLATAKKGAKTAATPEPAKAAPHRERRTRAKAGGMRKKERLPHPPQPVSRKGPSRPYDRPVDFLTGPQPMDKLVKLAAPVNHEVIYTDDLARAQKQVEAVFFANAVEIPPPSQRVLKPSQANLYQTLPKRRQTQTRPAPPREVQYLVYGTERQLRQLRLQLDTDVRAKQTVSQRPRRIAPRQDDRRTSGLAGQSRLTDANQRIAADLLISDKETAATQPGQVSKGSTTRGLHRQVSPGLPRATPPASQPTTRDTPQARFALTQSVRQMDQPVAPQSQRQGQIRASLRNNQAMLITLKKVRPQPKAATETKAKK